MVSRQALRSGSFHRKCAIVCAGLAGISAVLAGVLPWRLQASVDDHIRARTILDSNSSEAYDFWFNQSQPIVFKVYAFNITNPQAILAGEKPNVQELAPLTYQVVLQRFDVHWSDDNSTVKFKDFVQYVPVGDTEALSQQNITTINMPFLGFAGEYLEDIYLYYNCTGECLFTNRTIKDVVFGYNDSFLEQFGLSYPGFRTNFTSTAEASAYLGHSRMYTGVGIPQLNRNVVAWDGMASLNCCNLGSCGPNDRGGNRRAAWGGEEANQFGGTFGDQWPPRFAATSPTLPAFFTELYRPVSLVINGSGEVDVRRIPCRRFLLSNSTFANKYSVAANAVYDANGPSGVANISNCAFRANVFISKPHFFGGDSALLSNLTGLSLGNSSAHETTFEVEPLTGATMNMRKRLQINALVSKVPTFLPPPNDYFFPNVSETYTPIVWFDWSSEVTEVAAQKFISDIQQPLKNKVYAMWGGIAGAVAFAVLSAVLWAIGTSRKRVYDSALSSTSYVSLSSDKRQRGDNASYAPSRKSGGGNPRLGSPLREFASNSPPPMSAAYGTIQQ